MMDKSKIADGVTKDKIKEIEMGMPLEQVISILGNPYEIDCGVGHHNNTCKNPKLESGIRANNNADIIRIVDSIYNDTNYCCDYYKETKLEFGKYVTLTYTKRPSQLIRGLVNYSMLWVHIDSNYCVSGVYARKYEGFEGIDIYPAKNAVKSK